MVVEVAVNHEGPQKLLDVTQWNFSRDTSIRMWIGMEHSMAERKVLGCVGREKAWGIEIYRRWNN